MILGWLDNPSGILKPMNTSHLTPVCHNDFSQPNQNNFQPMQVSPIPFPMNQQPGSCAQNPFGQSDPFSMNQQQQQPNPCTPCPCGPNIPLPGPCLPVPPNPCAITPMGQSQIGPNGYLPQNILEQVRAYIGSSAPIFILPNNLPIPAQQPQPPQQPAPMGMGYPQMGYPPMGMGYPTSPPMCCPPPCYPYPFPLPVYDPFASQFRPSREKNDSCGCCQRRDFGQSAGSKNFGTSCCNYEAHEEHHCCPGNDESICTRKNCPSSINLQALASQFLSMQGIIPCAATRILLRRIPGSNINTSMEETIERAQKSINCLNKDQLLAEARNAQQVNALINLHMTANPPANIIPILTLLQLKVNLLKAHVETLVNRKMTECQGIVADGNTNIDQIILVMKSDAELREVLCTLRQKECEERVNVNFAPYHSQRVIAESRLNHVQNNIRQVEGEMERRRQASMPWTPMGTLVPPPEPINVCGLRVPDASFNNTPGPNISDNATNNPYGGFPNHESPNPFTVQVRNPKRLNVKPCVGSPQTTYERPNDADKNVCAVCTVTKDNDNEKCSCGNDDCPKNCQECCATSGKCKCCNKSCPSLCKEVCSKSGDEAKKKLQINVDEKGDVNVDNNNSEEINVGGLLKLSPNVVIVIDKGHGKPGGKGGRKHKPPTEKKHDANSRVSLESVHSGEECCSSTSLSQDGQKSGDDTTSHENKRTSTRKDHKKHLKPILKTSDTSRKKHAVEMVEIDYSHTPIGNRVHDQSRTDCNVPESSSFICEDSQSEDSIQKLSTDANSDPYQRRHSTDYVTANVDVENYVSSEKKVVDSTGGIQPVKKSASTRSNSSDDKVPKFSPPKENNPSTEDQDTIKGSLQLSDPMRTVPTALQDPSNCIEESNWRSEEDSAGGSKEKSSTELGRKKGVPRSDPESPVKNQRGGRNNKHRGTPLEQREQGMEEFRGNVTTILRTQKPPERWEQSFIKIAKTIRHNGEEEVQDDSEADHISNENTLNAPSVQGVDSNVNRNPISGILSTITDSIVSFGLLIGHFGSPSTKSSSKNTMSIREESPKMEIVKNVTDRSDERTASKGEHRRNEIISITDNRNRRKRSGIRQWPSEYMKNRKNFSKHTKRNVYDGNFERRPKVSLIEPTFSSRSICYELNDYEEGTERNKSDTENDGKLYLKFSASVGQRSTDWEHAMTNKDKDDVSLCEQFMGQCELDAIPLRAATNGRYSELRRMRHRIVEDPRNGKGFVITDKPTCKESQTPGKTHLGTPYKVRRSLVIRSHLKMAKTLTEENQKSSLSSSDKRRDDGENSCINLFEPQNKAQLIDNESTIYDMKVTEKFRSLPTLDETEEEKLINNTGLVDENWKLGQSEEKVLAKTMASTTFTKDDQILVEEETENVLEKLDRAFSKITSSSSHTDKLETAQKCHDMFRTEISQDFEEREKLKVQSEEEILATTAASVTFPKDNQILPQEEDVVEKIDHVFSKITPFSNDMDKIEAVQKCHTFRTEVNKDFEEEEESEVRPPIEHSWKLPDKRLNVLNVTQKDTKRKGEVKLRNSAVSQSSVRSERVISIHDYDKSEKTFSRECFGAISPKSRNNANFHENTVNADKTRSPQSFRRDVKESILEKIARNIQTYNRYVVDAYEKMIAQTMRSDRTHNKQQNIRATADQAINTFSRLVEGEDPNKARQLEAKIKNDPWIVEQVNDILCEADEGTNIIQDSLEARMSRKIMLILAVLLMFYTNWRPW